MYAVGRIPRPGYLKRDRASVEGHPHGPHDRPPAAPELPGRLPPSEVQVVATALVADQVSPSTPSASWPPPPPSPSAVCPSRPAGPACASAATADRRVHREPHLRGARQLRPRPRARRRVRLHLHARGRRRRDLRGGHARRHGLRPGGHRRLLRGGEEVLRQGRGGQRPIQQRVHPRRAAATSPRPHLRPLRRDGGRPQGRRQALPASARSRP